MKNVSRWCSAVDIPLGCWLGGLGPIGKLDGCIEGLIEVEALLSDLSGFGLSFTGSVGTQHESSHFCMLRASFEALYGEYGEGAM